ncbi:hypothetical protein [Saliphagus infecundisoli]|uniref:C2H2-type domain-containing protein n=1 Tax=Saliphagus infecundisoli TaxID=1849069 RepID=A0ABD5QCZ0_9EURY|nr:hypothetical protein [Saliphagus infecundisoli]
MGPTHDCLLCTDSYDDRDRLRVHLEVEHRKSELAVYAVEHADRERSTDPDGRSPRSP